MFIIRLAAEALSIVDQQTGVPATKNKPSKAAAPMTCLDNQSSNFLYSILSGQEDTSSAQQRSQLCASRVDQALREAFLQQQQKQRSNSVILQRPRVKCATSSKRPRSVPDSTPRFTPYPLHKRLHLADPKDLSNSDAYSGVDSPARSLSTDSGLDEPLDLTKPGMIQSIGSDADSVASSPAYSEVTFAMPHQSYLAPPALKPHYDSTNSSPSATQCVQLTKKMARPVQSRVSDWLRQMVTLVTPHHSSHNSRLAQLPAATRLRLLQSSWHRLLVLYMAEHALRFVTSPLYNSNLSGDDEDSINSNDRKKPVRANQGFVDHLTDLIDHCSSLPFDHSTYDYIRIAVLLMGNQKSCDSTNLSLLEKYLNSRTDVSQLRTILSQLESVSKDQLEALFCAHYSVPVEELLKLYFDEQSS